jgi:preprotein translocase subunit SecE
LNRVKVKAKWPENFGRLKVEEEEVELETETAGVRAPQAPGGTPPIKVERGTRPSSGGSGGDGGGRREKAQSHGGGFFSRTSQFLRDTRAEMRRVSWPTLNEVKNTTIITLIAVVFFSLYLFGVDRVWGFLIEKLRTLLGG